MKWVLALGVLTLLLLGFLATAFGLTERQDEGAPGLLTAKKYRGSEPPGGLRLPSFTLREYTGRRRPLGRPTREGRPRHIPRFPMHRGLPNHRRSDRADHRRPRSKGSREARGDCDQHRSPRGHAIERAAVPRSPTRSRQGALPDASGAGDSFGLEVVQSSLVPRKR